MTEQDLVSNLRPVDDQLDATHLPTHGQDDQFDKPTDNSEWKMEGEEGMHSDYQKQPEQPPRDDLGIPKTDPNLASFSEYKPPTGFHQDEKLVDPDKQGFHDGESGIHMTFDQFDTDQNQQASNEHMNTYQPRVHKLFETPPPTATPPPNAVLPDEMLALLNTAPNNGRVVRDDHATYTSGRSDQLPPEMQGNLPRDSDNTGSSGIPQQPTHANDAWSPESGGSLEDRNIDSGERVDRIDIDDDDDDDDDWDWGEKPYLKHADGRLGLDPHFNQLEGSKPPLAGGSESKITAYDANTEQLISDPGQSTFDPNVSDHSDSNEQNEEKKMSDQFDDDYFDDHYWDDVPEPEYTDDDNSGQTEEPVSPFEPLEEQEQQQRPPVQEVLEEHDKESEVREEYPPTVDDGDGNRGDSQGHAQSVDESPSSDSTQSDALQSDTDTASAFEAPPTEAPPTVVSSFEAPSSEFPRLPDTYHSEFGSPSSSDVQPDGTDDKTPPSEAPPASVGDKTPPTEDDAPPTEAPRAGVEDKTPPTEDAPPSEAPPTSDEDKTPPIEDKAPPQTQPSGFESKTPPSEAETDTRQSEAPPPSQSDISDHQQVETASRLDPNVLGVNDIDLQSIGIQPSPLHPSPSVTQLPGAGGDSEQPNINADSEKNNHPEEVYPSSQLPSEEEQKHEPEKDVIIDGTHLPDDDEDDDAARTTPFQPPVFTQSVASTPIPSSGSTDVGNDGDTRDQEPPSLDEIKAYSEQLRAKWNSEHHQTDSSADAHTTQETLTDQEIAATDGGASSTTADHQSETRHEAPQPVEDTPNQLPDQSEPVIEDGVTPPPPYSAYESGEGGASGEDTPTPPPVDADSAFEEPPPPPRSGYSCRDDYLPMPGHSRGGWMAYHEQVRIRVRDLVLDALPKEWSEWVCHNVSFVYHVVGNIGGSPPNISIAYSI